MSDQQSFDMNSLLALMGGMGKKSKSNLSGMSSMLNFFDNPLVGLLTGSFDPLSQQSQEDVPTMNTYDIIANNPDESKSVLEIAKQIVDEGKPYFQVAHFIDNNLADFGGYLPEELKNIAKTLDSEKKARDTALSKNKKTDIFSKAGLPNVTEQYSDNPSLVKFNGTANDYTSGLIDQAASLFSQADQLKKSGKFKGRQSTTGYNQKDLLNAMRKAGFDKTTQQYKTASGLKADQNGLIAGANLDTVKGLVGNQFKTDYDLRKLKPKTVGAKASQKEYGDLSDPEALANYFAIQSKIQSANQLATKAMDYKSGIINQAERAGHTPLMDTLAKRMMQIRSITG
jgi:hypothetical protein